MAHTPPQALPLTPALLAHLAALLPELVRPKQPAEAALAAYLKSQPKLGARDRALLGDAAYHGRRLRRGY